MKLSKSLSQNRSSELRLVILSFMAAAAVVGAIWSVAVQPSLAQPAPTRIAVIDVQKVLTQSTAGKAATAKLKTLQDTRMSRAKAMDEEMRKLNTEFSAAGVTPARRRGRARCRRPPSGSCYGVPSRPAAVGP